MGDNVAARSCAFVRFTSTAVRGRGAHSRVAGPRRGRKERCASLACAPSALFCNVYILYYQVNLTAALYEKQEKSKSPL